MHIAQFSSFFKKYLDVFVLAVIAALFLVLHQAGAFTKFDYRLYDVLLGAKKETAADPDIMLVEIDNQSVDALGSWPWSRDILADSLIRMKELGASTAVFDIEYLSPSQLGVNPEALNSMDQVFADGSNEITETIGELSDAVASGQVSSSEVPGLTQMMLSDYIDPALSSMKTKVTDKIYRNNDDYFSRAAQFFGNTWLTVNLRDVSIKISDDDLKYVNGRFLYRNVTDPHRYIDAANKFTNFDQYDGEPAGFEPAIHLFVSHAAGLGYTNVIADSDGTRRRIELLQAEKDGYAGQLVVAPLLRKIDPEKIERTKHFMILHNVLLPGKTKRTTIRIPLDSHGRMYINWLHQRFNKSFKHESILYLRQLDDMEANMYTYLQNIANMTMRNNDGSDMEYAVYAEELAKKYAAIKKEKEHLLSICTGYDGTGKALDGITEEQYGAYFQERADYFRTVGEFLSAGYGDSIKKRADELSKGADAASIAEFVQTLNDQFDGLSGEYKQYEQDFTEMSASYKNAFCILGETASSTTDLGVTPFEQLYPNVGTHANVLNTILQQDFIYPISWAWGMLFAVSVAFAVLFLTHHRSTFVQNMTGACSIAVIAAVFILLMVLKGIYIPSVTPILFIIVQYFVLIILRFAKSEKEKGFLRQAFSTYLSKDVVNEIVNDPAKLTLGGQDKHITALFTDIRSFSSFSEMVTPTQLVSILNIYLGMLSDTILKYGGTIDKYIGDEIVSFFGAPLDLPDHAYRACCSGVRMKQSEKLFNEKHLHDGDIPRELETRVGINTGNMVVGNMGTDMKMNYTIMGNDVNLASRLEGVNKIYKSWVLVSEQTWSEADSGEHKGELVARRLDKVRVIGINKPVQLYNILGFKSEMSKTELDEIDMFHAALDTYLSRDFKKAQTMFLEADKLKADGAATVFADRCKTYIEQGVPAEWDGVMTMTTK